MKFFSPETVAAADASPGLENVRSALPIQVEVHTRLANCDGCRSETLTFEGPNGGFASYVEFSRSSDSSKMEHESFVVLEKYALPSLPDGTECDMVLMQYDNVYARSSRGGLYRAAEGIWTVDGPHECRCRELVVKDDRLFGIFTPEQNNEEWSPLEMRGELYERLPDGWRRIEVAGFRCFSKFTEFNGELMVWAGGKSNSSVLRMSNGEWIDCACPGPVEDDSFFRSSSLVLTRVGKELFTSFATSERELLYRLVTTEREPSWELCHPKGAGRCIALSDVDGQIVGTFFNPSGHFRLDQSAGNEWIRLVRPSDRVQCERLLPVQGGLLAFFPVDSNSDSDHGALRWIPPGVRHSTRGNSIAVAPESEIRDVATRDGELLVSAWQGALPRAYRLVDVATGGVLEDVHPPGYDRWILQKFETLNGEVFGIFTDTYYISRSAIPQAVLRWRNGAWEELDPDRKGVADIRVTGERIFWTSKTAEGKRELRSMRRDAGPDAERVTFETGPHESVLDYKLWSDCPKLAVLAKRCDREDISCVVQYVVDLE